MAATTIFTGVNLQALANGAGLISAAQTITGDPIVCQLQFTAAVSIAAGVSFALYLVPSVDGGATFSDGSASVVPQAANLVATFICYVGTTQQTLNTVPIKLPNLPFKFVLYNNTAQAVKNDTTSTLVYSQPPRLTTNA